MAQQTSYCLEIILNSVCCLSKKDMASVVTLYSLFFYIVRLSRKSICLSFTTAKAPLGNMCLQSFSLHCIVLSFCTSLPTAPETDVRFSFLFYIILSSSWAVSLSFPSTPAALAWSSGSSLSRA